VGALAAWDSFYVIVGSAAGALIGLQFVVLALVAERPPIRAADAGAAFATPTIVHFVAVLFVSALLRVPFRTVVPAAGLWGLAGVVGVAYAAVVARRMRKQDVYRPVFEDWMFHVALPSAAYATLAVSSLFASGDLTAALFGPGAAALLLLFIGIHNAWDAVAYHVFVNMKDERTGRDSGQTRGNAGPGNDP
jgi:hypothetical protein